MKILIVVDMQNDFVGSGALGTPESEKIIPNVFSKIKEYVRLGDIQKVENENNDDTFGIDFSKNVFGLNSDKCTIIFTRDTHYKDSYKYTEEGKNLPIPHCLACTEGWYFIPEFDYFTKYGKIFNVIEKGTFGSDELIRHLQGLYKKFNIESIELIGLCTDICVIANAIIAKSALPNVPIYVDSSCWAGTTPEMHDKAIELMENSLQIHILKKGLEPWRNTK